MISTSRTLFLPKLLTSQIASSNVASARTNIGNSHNDICGLASDSVIVRNVSSETENQTISHNMCF